MSRIKRISEVFEETSKFKLKKDRISHLQTNQSVLMKYMAQGAYHPGVVWLLPKGVPPHKSANPLETEMGLHQELQRLYLFCKGGNDSLKQYDREKLFINVLEKLHPADAELLCAVKDKRINYPFLTYALFKEAFPDWLPDKEKEDGE